MLIVTLALPLALAILTFFSRLTGSADTILALFLFCTVSVYVSLGAGLVVPVWIGVVWLFGGSIERRTIVALLLLSALNVAVAIIWIGVVVPQAHFRY